jgi:hypothetical protein
MDLRQEERANRGNKRVLSEIDVSEWEITCKKTRPREGKQRCDTSKATQLPVGETPSQATRLRKKKKKLRLVKKDQQQIFKPGDLPPRLCYNCRKPGHYANECPNPKQQKLQHQDQTSEQLSLLTARTPFFEGSQTHLTLWVTSLSKSHFPISSSNYESRDEILLKGGRL